MKGVILNIETSAVVAETLKQTEEMNGDGRYRSPVSALPKIEKVADRNAEIKTRPDYSDGLDSSVPLMGIIR